MIEARGLSARVGSFRLDDVTFTVPKGAYGVVIGPAGSGKTTLLETIAGITPQTGGTLHLDGRRASSASARAATDSVSSISTAICFRISRSRQNIAYGASDADVAREVATRLGASALRDRAVESLSGGERQLVALARALAIGGRRSCCSTSRSARSTRGDARRRVASCDGFIASGA